MQLATNDQVINQAKSDVLFQAGLAEEQDFIKSASVTLQQQALYDEQFALATEYIKAEMQKSASAPEPTIEDYIAAQAQNDVLAKYNIEEPIAFVEKNASYTKEQQVLYANVKQSVENEVVQELNKQKSASNPAQSFVDSVAEQLFSGNLQKTASWFEQNFKK